MKFIVLHLCCVCIIFALLVELHVQFTPLNQQKARRSFLDTYFDIQRSVHRDIFL